MKTEAEEAIAAIQKLVVPQGKRAGHLIVLADYQRQFIEGALAPDTSVGVLSIGRGNGKTALAAALATTHLLGCWDAQPQREIVIAARTADQAGIAFKFSQSFMDHLPAELEPAKVTVRKHPHFMIAIEAPDGPHVLKCVSSDGKSQLGGSPTLCILDERAAWRAGRGEDAEAALLTGLGKRSGRAVIISTSAPDDANSFSQWCDRPPSGCYVQEHRPKPGLDADDEASLMVANPGAAAGIGATPDWLVRQAQQAIERGGSALASFRNLIRNERVATDGRDMLLSLDAWLQCEVDELPAREGKVIIGLDLGGSTSMTASAFFWPATGRLEVLGWFPSHPSLADRGERDHVGSRYMDMQREGSLRTLGHKTVPLDHWMAETMEHVGECDVECILADRFKRAELSEAMQAQGINCRVSWRGQGWRDGSEDARRFQRMVYGHKIKVAVSLLMRSALSDCVTVHDEAGNIKLSKARSTSRIDPVSAAVQAVSEGSRLAARPTSHREPLWA